MSDYNMAFLLLMAFLIVGWKGLQTGFRPSYFWDACSFLGPKKRGKDDENFTHYPKLEQEK